METHLDLTTSELKDCVAGIYRYDPAFEQVSAEANPTTPGWKIWIERLLGAVVRVLRSAEARAFAKAKFGELIDAVLSEPKPAPPGGAA